jgi:hydroxymethylpyrimidine/phosphomethylpyrimidine kinase
MNAIALTIAGSDSGGGAGIQADLKTFSALGVFGTSVITAITAQNTLGVRAVEDISPEMVGHQIDAIFDDIAVGATKIGMVSRVATIAMIAERLSQRAVRPVLDPVMVATSGDRLLAADAVGALREQLLPLAALVTPNLPEAALLADTGIAENEQDMIAQAEAILKSGAGAVLVKGGHGDGAESVDILVTNKGTTRYAAPRVQTPNTHGTGCTLSAAIAAGLASGLTLEGAVEQAKAYLQKSLLASDRLHVGRGHGPVHHFHHWWENR